MRIRNMVLSALVAGAGAALPMDRAHAAKAPDCTNDYLLCLNEASQDENFFWRTAKETECGLGYFGCLRNKVSGQ